MIENQLQEWGVAQRQLPHEHYALKQQLLAKFSPAPGKLPKGFRLPWLSLAFASLAVVVFIGSAFQASKVALPTQTGFTGQFADSETSSGQTNNSGAGEQFAQPQSGISANKSASAPSRSLEIQPPAADGVISSYPNYQEVPITDSRELLKISYSASVQTRRVQQTAESAQTIVRGLEGRVDSFSASESHAFISFALPQEKLDQMRVELKNLAGARFLIESTQGQNMLPQKQNLEQQNTQAQKQLSQMHTDRDQLTSKHSQVIYSLKAQLSAAKKELADLQAQSSYNFSFAIATQARQEELQRQIFSLNAQIANENSIYADSLANIKQQIKRQTDYLGGIQKQDSNLMDSVATVQGTISFQQINWLEFINAYVSLYWFGLALALGAFASFYFHPRMLI